MDAFLRIFLPIYLLAFFLLAFVWRSWLVWKRTGINPYVVAKSTRPIDFVESLYRIPTIMLAAVALVFAFFPALYEYLSPIRWLDAGAVKIAGLVFLIASLSWIAIAQMQMGVSWRIGIDPANKTALVKKGLFTVSRNPIFLGMRMALAGFFLTLPNAFTLLAMGLGDVLMQIQVRLEEQHLISAHGDDYERYRKDVRRWI